MNPIDIINQYADNSTNLNSLHVSGMYGFSLRHNILPHTRFRLTLSRIAELHHYSQHNQAGSGLLIIGTTGIGKSSALKHYHQLFPKVQESQYTRIPVVLVTTPASPTVKNMAEAILTAMNDPMATRGSAEEKTLRIYQLFARCKVELLLIDEFQHFFYTHTIVEFRRITDWLKNFISVTDTGVVLCGLPEAEMVVESNEQLARRFSSKYTLTTFSLDPKEDFNEFRGILRSMQEALPLPVETALYEANLARRFLVGSNGVLDYVRKILEGAVSIAGAAGHQSLDLPVFAAGFKKEVWIEVGDRLNPFHPESPLRALNRPGEPFYTSHKRHTIGSPLARRLNLSSESSCD
jgi:DNA transposition AAA+ family ATPase